MTLAPGGDLAAAEVAFYAPALIISIFILIRHGFNKQLGWFYLAILSILRIIGAATTLYMKVNNDYSASLIETAAITSAVGTSPLLLATMGFLERIHQGMERKGVPLNIFRPLHLAALVALVIAIIGGVDNSHTDNTSDLQTGKDLLEAASILFLAICVALAGITVYTMTNSRWVLSNEKKLMMACAAALPFLLVRVIYSVASAFSNPGSIFYFRNVNVWVSAFMQFLMEAIVVSIFIVAGMLTPRMEKRDITPAAKDIEGQPDRYEMQGAPAPHSGRAAGGYHQSRPQRQQRSLGDYRPSRLIMNAIRDRQQNWRGV